MKHFFRAMFITLFCIGMVAAGYGLGFLLNSTL